MGKNSRNHCFRVAGVLLASSLIIGGLLGPNLLSAKPNCVYHWQDEEGISHFSQKPLNKNAHCYSSTNKNVNIVAYPEAHIRRQENDSEPRKEPTRLRSRHHSQPVYTAKSCPHKQQFKHCHEVRKKQELVNQMQRHKSTQRLRDCRLELSKIHHKLC